MNYKYGSFTSLYDPKVEDSGVEEGALGQPS